MIAQFSSLFYSPGLDASLRCAVKPHQLGACLEHMEHRLAETNAVQSCPYTTIRLGHGHICAIGKAKGERDWAKGTSPL